MGIFVIKEVNIFIKYFRGVFNLRIGEMRKLWKLIELFLVEGKRELVNLFLLFLCCYVNLGEYCVIF